MEQRPLILFGNFSEKETHLYFSDDSLKSCGIEFPDDFLPFVKFGYEASSAVVFVPSTEAEKEVEFTKESESTCVEEKPVNELGNESKDASKYINDRDILACQTNRVSDKNEIDNVVERDVTEFPQCDTISDTQVEPASQNGQNFTQDNVSLVEECQAIPEQKAAVNLQGADVPKPTNVVTVGTKTMVTNTTTVRSGHHEPVKSSWADLFKTKPSSKPQGPINSTLQSSEQPGGETTSKSIDKDQFRQYFVDVLKKTELSNQIPHLQPRGLKNNANWCYINATLQVLIFCPSFYHFLMKFRLKTDRGKSSTPILDALVLFASQFSKMALRQPGSKSQDWGKQDVIMGMPFEPTYIYDLLTQVKTTLSQQGKQEDAEEFLSCILNGLHEEMVQIGSTGDKQEPEVSSNHLDTKSEAKEESVGEWEQVGPRNKSTVTRKSTMAKSPVAEMFGGYLRSSLVQHGVKESASIQPFYSIQLDLRGDVTSVQQAFDHFFSVEEVEGFQCDKSKMEVEVSKKWTLDSLPMVLILHLKRFVVNKHGCEKLTKKVSYESELLISQDTISKVLKIRNKNMLTYKLFAITYHHGKNLHGGHYTSDIFHPAVGWLRADDVTIRSIPTKFVFNPLSNRDPYLLYYHRGDILV